MKISILGYSGSGKSTLARRIGESLSLPVFHLDQVHFKKNWEQKPYGEALEEVRSILKQDHWVIDGNYGNFLLQERLQDSDLILVLRMNRFLCLGRCYKRYRQFKGQTRPDVAAGCREKFDLPFIWWILYKGRNNQKRKAQQKKLEAFKEKTVYFNHQKEVRHFLENTWKGKHIDETHHHWHY